MEKYYSARFHEVYNNIHQATGIKLKIENATKYRQKKPVRISFVSGVLSVWVYVCVCVCVRVDACF